MLLRLPLISFFLIITFILSVSAIQINEECDAIALKAELKRELRPDFKYDSSKSTRFTYKNKKQVKEIEVPLFMGERYRFLFNTYGLPKNVEIEIYNKKSDNKKRKLLYSLEPKEGQYIYSFEPDKSRKMYVNYTIPETKEVELKGCIIFVLGYNLSILK
jgi:hypothetical protein